MSKLNLKQGNIEEYTIVLCTRDYRKIGQLSGVKIDSVHTSNKLNNPNEINFSLVKYDLLKPETKYFLSDEEYKKYLLVQELLWLQIVDQKLIWVKELDEYYEIKVVFSDTQEIEKFITATSLCEAELSQYKITLEINTESDISRDDYEVTTFCNFANPSASLLHRAIKDKAPHYKIGHVDESLQKIQRTFSVNEVDIYGFFTGEVSEQINCLFQFDSSTRTISAYDLYTTCSCGYRGEFYDECPECGNTNREQMKYFGKDTTIFVDTKNLTDEIQVETNADSIKNCLKMVAGDDLMTATVRLLNQNGSDYLYYISENQMKDMPLGLVDLLNKYQVDYDSYTEEYQKQLGILYQATDDILYLESGMMPTIEQAEVTAQTEADKLTEENLSPVALSYVTKGTSVSTASAAIKNYAKVYAKSGYVKIDIADGATFEYVGEDVVNKWMYGIWTGRIIVTNYSDETDVVTTEPLSIIIHDNYEEFVRQKVLKQLSQEDDEGSVFDVLAIEDLDKFKTALTYYGKNRLQSFHDAIQGALDVLIQLNQATDNAELYNVLYSPYYEKLQACQMEIDKRQAEIDLKQQELDNADKVISEIQSKLNFQNYLGDEYYKIYCAYRREDTYSNANYISDGLSNVELIDRAKEFIETAKKELVKAAEPQYTISSTLKNFLVLPEFEPIINYFELGNWIRVKADNDIYSLRLIGYDIDFGNLDNLSVEFSTVSKTKDVVDEAQQVINSAKSMSTNFSYVAKQAEKGKDANNSINEILNHGFDTGLAQINNNVNEEVIMNKHGILCRSYDEETDTYSPEQLKFTHNVMAFTDNAWVSCKSIIGKHEYKYYDEVENGLVDATAYGLTAEFISALDIYGKNIIGGTIRSENYSNGTNNKQVAGTFIDLINGTLSIGGGKLVLNKDNELFLLDGTIQAGTVIGTSMIGGSIASENYSNEEGNQAGSYINLTDGSLDLAGGGLTYSKENGLQIESQAIENTLASVGVLAEKLRIKAININVDDGKIQSGQIESISASQITGDIHATTAFNAESVPASGITGTIETTQISEKLINKSVTGTFTGDVVASSVEVTDSDGTTYTGITGEFEIISPAIFKFVNGICVEITQTN